MADLPIIFSDVMVRAQLAGRKTQTRRILSDHWQAELEGHDRVKTWFAPLDVPKKGIPNQWAQSGIWAEKYGEQGYNKFLGFARYRPGDRLWVREAWAKVGDAEDDIHACPDLRVHAYYRADATCPEHNRWRSPIHMPRRVSRLTDIVTEVRVQRLQDITEEDAIAEGVEPLHTGYFPYGITTFLTTFVGDREVPAQCCRTAKHSYEMLWKSLHGPGAWERNDWVAAYTFTVHHGNIDNLPAPLGVEQRPQVNRNIRPKTTSMAAKGGARWPAYIGPKSSNAAVE